jgi:hypothetical protein
MQETRSQPPLERSKPRAGAGRGQAQVAGRGADAAQPSDANEQPQVVQVHSHLQRFIEADPKTELLPGAIAKCEMGVDTKAASERKPIRKGDAR